MCEKELFQEKTFEGIENYSIPEQEIGYEKKNVTPLGLICLFLLFYNNNTPPGLFCYRPGTW